MPITNINLNSQTNQYKKPSTLFFNDMTNIKNFDPSLLGLDKISLKSNDAVIYHSQYITRKGFDNANSLYLIFNIE